MNYAENFVKLIQLQDNRNIFATVSRHNIIPCLAPLYSKYDPIDVEIVLKDLTAIRLYPLDQFALLSREYNFANSSIVIFATWEGDPIYVENDKIYIATHGIGEYLPEAKFDSLNLFLEWIVQNIRI